MISEENITKKILSWLIQSKWTILSSDYPQSGTGIVFHQDNTISKNKGILKPDIVAVKDDVCLFFENKNRFYYPDYVKVNNLIVNNNYSKDIATLLSGRNINSIYYGIGFPSEFHKQKSIESAHLVDFIIGVSDENTIEELYNPSHIAFT
ncbi:MAG: hypothetical protein LUE27_02225 [Clostridia bacterium]|nr:hypothetical protein [Clostridia bacterium]